MPFIKKACSIVRNFLDEREEINVEKLSKELKLDPSQVYRKVKKETGNSTAVFIRNVKLQRGKELLQNEDLSIKEISGKAGFADSNYFIQCFKRKFKKTPNKFRKK